MTIQDVAHRFLHRVRPPDTIEEPTPWHATQRAAWEALTKAVVDG